MPDTAADAVLVELAMEVPLLFVPCQYQVMPEGADPERVSVLSPHVLVETEKAAGWLGSGLKWRFFSRSSLRFSVSCGRCCN